MPIEERYRNFAFAILEAIKQRSEEFKYADEDNLADGEFKSLLFYPSNFSISFLRRDNNLFYLALYRKSHLIDIDLSLIVQNNDRFTWFLAGGYLKEENRNCLDNLLKHCDNLSPEYREGVRSNKRLLNTHVMAWSSGYLLCENATRNELINKIVEVIMAVAAEHGCDVEYRKTQVQEQEINFEDEELFDEEQESEDNFNFDDSRAIEGYEFDLVIIARGRDRQIVEERKRHDNYTCQCCGFFMQINNIYVVDCHHFNPIVYGVRETKINDLISLCPNCHRIAHTRNPPIGIEEIKQLRNNAPPNA